MQTRTLGTDGLQVSALGRGFLTGAIDGTTTFDQAAKVQFVGPDCGLCTDPGWSTYRANAALQAL